MYSQISTVKLLALFNVLALGVIIVTTTYAIEHGPKRVAVVGWICAVFSVCVFAAPLSIMVNYLLFYLINQTFSNLYCYQFNYMRRDKCYVYVQRLVIKTKSVEYMPFSLSFFLTLCAIMWFFYGLLIKDYYVAVSFKI